MSNHSKEIGSDKKLCEYCQSPIKHSEEIFYCPRCNAPYHEECWYENNGCAVYGCGQKAKSIEERRDKRARSIESVDDMFVNIEFYINERRFVDAIGETKRILRIEKRNIKAKRFYNKAVSLVNTKTKLLEDADEAFGGGNYREAEIYYANAMEFADDDERELIKSRLQVIKEKIPSEKKRKRNNGVIITVIVVLILASAGYLGYYYIILEEDRDFAAIEKEDTYDNVHLMEIQISKYERFARKYRDGNNFYKALDKISFFSGILADSLSKNDWREAFGYLDKIDSTRSAKTYRDLQKKIYEVAEKEYDGHLKNVKKLNSRRKYSEAKTSVQKALDIVDEFPDSGIAENRDRLMTNMAILRRKISAFAKYESIKSEIDEKIKELKNHGVDASSNSNIVLVNAVVMEVVSASLVTARLSQNDKLVAIRSTGYRFTPGEFVSLDCRREGNITVYGDDSNENNLSLYIPDDGESSSNALVPDSYIRQSLLQRLDYLKSQKSKLDSILNLKLL